MHLHRTSDDARYLGDGLARCAISRDAEAHREREGQLMALSSNGHPSDRQPKGPAEALGSGPFSKMAAEGAAKKVSEVLGEIVWLMSQSPLHKQFFISDLEWLVMAPVLLQQFRLFYDRDKPIGVAFWATVNAEVEVRLAAGT